MSTHVCAHEEAVVQLVLGGRWPDAAEAGLRVHAESCEVCREVVSLVGLLRSDFQATHEALARRDYPLPSAGQIWWRAAVAARADATRAATRPLVWGYGLAAACAAGLAVAGAGYLWPTLSPVTNRVPAIAPALDQLAMRTWLSPAAMSATDAVVATLRAEMPVVLGVVACLVATPVAIYVALRGE